MPNYTLIEYMSSGSTSCRGCTMERWSSDHEISFFDNREALIEHYARKEYENEQREFGTWYFTVLIDGRDRNNDIWNDDILGYEHTAEFDLIDTEVKKLIPVINVYQTLKR